MSKIISGSQTGNDSRMQVISRADFQLGLRMLPSVVRIDTLLPKKPNRRTRKALMRARGVHGPIQAAARFSASLHRVGGTVFDRPFADSVEAVFIFIAFRRFPHFSDNQQERTHSCNEKPYGYDHESNLSMICAIIIASRSLSYQYTLSRFSIGEFTTEMPTQTNAREPVKSFR